MRIRTRGRATEERMRAREAIEEEVEQQKTKFSEFASLRVPAEQVPCIYTATYFTAALKSHDMYTPGHKVEGGSINCPI